MWGEGSALRPGSTPSSESRKCDPAYPTLCVPLPPPDLDCGDIPYRGFKSGVLRGRLSRQVACSPTNASHTC